MVNIVMGNVKLIVSSVVGVGALLNWVVLVQSGADDGVTVRSIEDEIEVRWKEYKRRFNKHYSSPSEEQMRYFSSAPAVRLSMCSLSVVEGIIV